MYKYKIHYYLRQLTYDDYTIAMSWLPKKLCIEKETFRKWIYAKKNGVEISFKNLEILAAFFEVEPTDLITERKVLCKNKLKDEFESFKNTLKKSQL